MTTFRLLPFETGPGPYQMAADEAMVHTAAAGFPSLRFYRWSEATASLGYFQPAAARLSNPRLAGLPWVRRPSGGKTIVHHREATYSLAIPPGPFWNGATPWMPRMHALFVQALARLDVPLTLVDAPQGNQAAVICFQQFTPGDVLCRGHKVIGSAQRKHHQALLQHGSILLEQSEHTPELPGILELTGKRLDAEGLIGVIVEAFEKDTGWTAAPGHWDAQEQALIANLIETRYGTPAWNEKR